MYFCFFFTSSHCYRCDHRPRTQHHTEGTTCSDVINGPSLSCCVGHKKTPTASAGVGFISHFLSQVSTSHQVPQSLILILKTTFLPSLMQQFSYLCCTALFSPIQLNHWCSQVPLTQPTASRSRKIVLELPELPSYLATVWEKFFSHAGLRL